MKLPFDFGIKLIFRLIVPGFFLTLGLLPVIKTALEWGAWNPSPFDYVFIFALIFLGWLIVISDMQIYMLFEGRRFWPPILKTFFLKRERIRLNKLLGALTLDETVAANKRRKEEAYVDLRNFPMDDQGQYEVRFPSRLGNLLSAYEDYSKRIYGMDSVFYWYRIWLKTDKDLREEIDNQQAIADSSVYTSFALYFSGLLWLIYAVIYTSQWLTARYIPAVKDLPVFFGILIEIVLGLKILLTQHVLIDGLLAVILFLMGFLTYRLSLRLHAQFGELFKSMFDVSESGDKKLDVSKIIKEISTVTDDLSFLSLPRRDQLTVAWRYLQFYRIRCPRCNQLLRPAEARAHIHAH